MIRKWIESRTVTLCRGVDGLLKYPPYSLWLRVRIDHGCWPVDCSARYETWLFIKTPVFAIRTDPEILGRGWHQIVLMRTPRGWRTFWKKAGRIKQVRLLEFLRKHGTKMPYSSHSK